MGQGARPWKGPQGKLLRGPALLGWEGLPAALARAWSRDGASGPHAFWLCKMCRRPWPVALHI